METPDLESWWTQYKAAYEHRSWRDYRQILAAIIREAQQAPILDVGCGYGFVVECARQFGIHAVGIESAGHALAEGRSRHPLADIRDWTAGRPLPLESGSCGAVLLNQVVDHFTMDENDLLFADIRRVLVRDGVLLAYSPSRFNRFEQDTGHVTLFSPSEFRDFVEKHGFRVREQPYRPQMLLGQSAVGKLAIRAVTQFVRPERLATTIDLVATR